MRWNVQSFEIHIYNNVYWIHCNQINITRQLQLILFPEKYDCPRCPLYNSVSPSCMLKRWVLLINSSKAREVCAPLLIRFPIECVISYQRCRQRKHITVVVNCFFYILLMKWPSNFFLTQFQFHFNFFQKIHVLIVIWLTKGRKIFH